MHAGTITHITAEAGVLSYRRHLGDQHLQVFLNLTGDLQTVACEPGKVLITTILDGDGGQAGGKLILEAGEGLLIALD